VPATLQQVSFSPLPDAQVAGIGPLSALAGSGPYQITQLKYPLEGLGTIDTPHYMTFNINVPTSSKYITNNPKASTNVLSTAQQNQNYIRTVAPGTSVTGPTAGQLGTGVVVNTLTKVPTGDVGGVISSAIGGGALLGAAKGLQIAPKTKRITTSISLYTPDTLTVQYDQAWNEVSLAAALGKVGKFAALGASNITKQLENKGDMFTNLASKAWKDGVGSINAADIQELLHFNGVGAEFEANIAEETGVAGPNFADLVLRSNNLALNPKNEMLFQGTPNRNFQFSFDFQPRSQKEAYEIYQIIRTFKAFAAPEYSSEATGRYMIPPAVFDIGFFFMNTENFAIPRISTCALTNISLDYNHTAPFGTFNDGFPVHINMQLQFKEIDIITRELIQKYGF
jgi:hypothetical protein